MVNWKWNSKRSSSLKRDDFSFLISMIFISVVSEVSLVSSFFLSTEILLKEDEINLIEII